MKSKVKIFIWADLGYGIFISHGNTGKAAEQKLVFNIFPNKENYK